MLNFLIKLLTKDEDETGKLLKGSKHCRKSAFKF